MDGDSDFEPTACDACRRAVRGLMLLPIDTKRIQHSDNRISKARANQQEGHATFFFFFFLFSGWGGGGRRLQARSYQLDLGF